MRHDAVVMVVLMTTTMTLGAHLPIGDANATSTSPQPCKTPTGRTTRTTARMSNYVADTYHVEHEISERLARSAAVDTDPGDLSSFAIGCEECTSSELDYCFSSAIIQDHCCCDGRFFESFPYVPHTCYRGKEMCKPVKQDCEEYVRVRDCCCRINLATKWRARLLGNGVTSDRRNSDLVIVFLLTLLPLVIKFDL